MSMFSKPVVYVDIETSGSNVERSKIIEIGVIRVEGGIIVDELQNAQQLTGLCVKQWSNKHLFGAIAGALVDFVQEVQIG